MVNQLLLNYIRQQFGAGVSREALLKTLAAAGWAKQDVDDTLAAVSGAPTTAAPVTPVTTTPSTPSTPSTPTTPVTPVAPPSSASATPVAPAAPHIPVAQTMAQAVAQAVTPATPVVEIKQVSQQPATGTPGRTFFGRNAAAPAAASPVRSPIQQTPASISVAAKKPEISQPSAASPARKRKWPLVLGIIVFLIVLIGVVIVFIWPMLQPILSKTQNAGTIPAATTETLPLPAATSTAPAKPVNSFSITPFNLPIPARVAGGTKNVVMGDILFQAASGPATLQKIDITLSSGGPADIVRVTLWNGSNLIATSTFNAGSTAASLLLSTPIPLTQGSGTTLTLKADLSAVGPTAGTDGDRVLVEVVGAGGTDQGSGQTISGGSNAKSPGARGVILSSNASIASTPSIADISPNIGRAGEGTQVTITGSDFTASSTVLLYGYSSPIKPDSVSAGKTKLVFTFPTDYSTSSQAGNALSISVPLVVSNTDTASFESGLTSNREYFTLVP